MTGRIPKTFIDDLLNRINLVELIDSNIPLRKTGSNYAACCPFHNEKSPSFTVSPTKQFYYCFGCGASGNAISFLMEYQHLSFVEAVETLAKQVGLEIPSHAAPNPKQQVSIDLYALLEKVSHYYQTQLRHHPVAINYLKQRGISGQIAKKFGIGFAPSGWDNLAKYFGNSNTMQTQLITGGMLIKKDDGGCYDRFRDRVMFPIRDRRGRVIAFGGRVLGNDTPKYLNSPETPLFHKGRELYGLYEARQEHRELTRLLIVEGYMDVIALAQHGIDYAVATLGTAATTDHLQYIFRTAPEVIFCFDGDRAGQAAAWRALETALPLIQDGLQIRFLLLPEGEDPDSLIRQEGTATFQERLNNSMMLSDFFFSKIGAQVNLSSLDGKTRLIALATPYINKIPEGVFQHMMLERLAQIVRIDSQKLISMVKKSRTVISTHAQQYQKAAPLKMARSYNLSPMRLAIALLLQNPSLAQTAPPEVIAKFDVPGSDVLNELIELLRINPHFNTGGLLEHWRGRKEAQLLAKLAAWQHTIPEQGIVDEFKATLLRLQSSNKEQQIEMLLAKANQQGLTQEEKRKLQDLITAHKSKD